MSVCLCGMCGAVSEGELLESTMCQFLILQMCQSIILQMCQSIVLQIQQKESLQTELLDLLTQLLKSVSLIQQHQESF